MSHVNRLLVTLILISAVVGNAGLVKADAISGKNKCTFFTKTDAERALHGPVVYLPSELDPTNCAWALAKDSNIGVTVAREAPPMYPPKADTPGVSQIHHITDVGKDAYTYYANAGAGGVYTADVLTSKGVTSVTLPEKAGNAATALAIARTMMNR